MRLVIALLPASLMLAQTAPVIEERGAASWPTRNHYRFAVSAKLAAGHPVWADIELPVDLHPDSIRVIPRGASAAIPAKLDWRAPQARLSWIAAAARVYDVYFDRGAGGETEPFAEPAMTGAGDRVTHGRRGVRGRLAVGLWAYPAALDMDRDGDPDLVAACTDRPYNGTYLFRNIGTAASPLFARGEWLGPGLKDLVAADADGDGALDLVFGGGYFRDPARNRLSQRVPITLPRTYHVGRDDLYYPVDWDRDGRIDILNGVSDWRDYGWDDAFNDKGEWTRGPLHGFVYWFRNTGSNREPRYEEPVRLPIDQYGSPSPVAVDWRGDGTWSLLLGEFLDRVWLFHKGARRPLLVGGRPLRMDLCMIQPRIALWHSDGRPSVIIGEEDGRVAFAENVAPRGQEPRFDRIRYFEQVDPYVKSGALSRPVAVDWNGDGLLDILSGNSAGYLQYFENTGTRRAPAFTDRGYLQAAGRPVRRVAGPNGSIQGPAEEKWGYSNPSVADWDLDGRLDILVNDIWGEVLFYRGLPNGDLAPGEPLRVEWPGAPPKPDWVWWQPKPGSLVTQWRTTPKAVDWNGDGLPDLVMLNHQGYLALFRRTRCAAGLCLQAPEKIFVEPNGRFLNLAAGRAGRSGRRKIEIADWDADGRLDLITDTDEGPVWYRNTGTAVQPVMEFRGAIAPVPLRGHNPTPNAADWNGDGRLDLLIGAEDGFFYFFDREYLDAIR